MNFSEITSDLFIGTTPRTRDYSYLNELGVRLVINMRYLVGPQGKPDTLPIKFLWLRTIDSPLFPIPVRKLLQGAQIALETIREGGKVYTHCEHGRHRAAAMGAAVLIAQGLAPDTSMQLIKQFRPISDPYVFYIRSRILRFAQQWATV